MKATQPPADMPTAKDPHHGSACAWGWDGVRLWHRHIGQSRWVETRRIHPTPARIRVLHNLMNGAAP